MRKMTRFGGQNREINFEYVICNIVMKHSNKPELNMIEVTEHTHMHSDKHRHSIGIMAGFQKVQFALQIAYQCTTVFI